MKRFLIVAALITSFAFATGEDLIKEMNKHFPPSKRFSLTIISEGYKSQDNNYYYYGQVEIQTSGNNPHRSTYDISGSNMEELLKDAILAAKLEEKK